MALPKLLAKAILFTASRMKRIGLRIISLIILYSRSFLCLAIIKQFGRTLKKYAPGCRLVKSTKHVAGQGRLKIRFGFLNPLS